VLRIIDELQKEGYCFKFDLIEGIPYEENLDRKRNADILIDDVDPVYEKFHNSSLEAACFGAISLTNYSGEDYPFVKTNVNDLKNTLIKYINNSDLLKEEQAKIVTWRKEHYNPKKLLNIYEHIYYDLINGKYFLKEHITITPESQQSIPIINQTKKDAIISIINYLNQMRIKFWLLKDSCLEALIKKEITSDIFYIGVNAIVEKNLILNQFPQYNNLINIQIENNRTIKNGKLYGLPINVPFPVIKYLEKAFNKTWDELQNEK
jgi:hypothetical protein